MAGVAVEQMLELWCAELRRVKAQLGSLFAHPSIAASAAAFLDGLLGSERRKTGWIRAEAAGDPGPWRQQAVLGRSHWDADALRDLVREYALETLTSPDAVLVLDETGFLKQGLRSCGVGRQYTGSAGKITNCQIGVFAAYVSSTGCALIDRALYLPQAWTNTPERLTAAQIPDAIHFATKPEIAAQMIARALAAGVPFAWVTADTVYGTGAIEMQLRRAGKGYVLGASATDPFNSWDKTPPVAGTAQQIARALSSETWKRVSAGDGTKGPRLYDWAYVELADLEADEDNADLTGSWTRGLLIRRNIFDQDLAFFSTWCPAGTDIATLVRVEGQRWAIEDAFETAKTELGLTHNETRSWHGWHRHVSLVMLALAMMTVVRQRANRLHSPQACTHPKKDTTRPGCRAGALVGPGNPPRGHTPRPASDRARLRDRLVDLAPRPSGTRAKVPPQTSTAQAICATVVLSVWMRDVLGGCDDFQSLGQSIWMRRLVASIDKGWLGLEATSHELLGGGAFEHALAARVVGLVEALEQGLEVAMAGDRDAQHLALHPSVEALHETVGLRCGGPGLAMLHFQLAAGVLKAIGRKARTPVGEHMRDLERESRDRLCEEGDRGFRGLVIFDGQMHGARAAVDGDREEAFAAFPVGRSELREVLDVEVHEAEIVVLEGAALPFGLVGWRQPPQPFGLEEAVDAVPIEMRQEMRDHEGQVIEGEAGGAAQRTDDGALLVRGLPGQLVRPAGAVLAVPNSALAPFAHRLGTDPAAGDQHAGGLV
jgi:SRSO17 transposase